MSPARNWSSVARGANGREPSISANQSGVVAIEFALVLPLILIVLFAIIEFGQLFNHLNDSNQIAADGARFAAVNAKPGGAGMTLQQFLADQADTSALKSKIKVCISFPNGNSGIGDPVTVETSSSFTLIPLLGGATLSLKGSATMRIERSATNYSGGC